MPDFVFHLIRPRDFCQDFSLSCGDLRVSYRAGRQNGMAMLAKALRDQGAEDGPVEIIERRPNGLRQYLPSLYTLSELPFGSLPEEKPDRSDEEDGQAEPKKAASMSAAVLAALERLKGDGSSWGDLPGITKGALKSLGLVEVASKTYATLNSEGLEALIRPAEPPAEQGFKIPETGQIISIKQKEALALVMQTPEKWMDLHGKTRNFVLNAGWVLIQEGQPIITENGRSIAEALGLLG